MSSIFPIRDKVTLDREPEPRLVDLDEETADEVFEALASTTTRKIFLELHNQPQTASDLADVTDTSVQNVQYHLEKLDTVDLVEVVDTWYSERGSEMKVYAPQDESLVLFAGRDKQSAFRRLLDRFAGMFALLVPPSILAGWLANRRDGAEESIRGEYAAADDDDPVEETFAAEADVVDDEEDEAVASDDVDDAPVSDDEPDAEATETPEPEPEPEGTPTPEPDGTPTPAPEDDVEDAEATTSTEFDGETVEIAVDNASEAERIATQENETVYLAVEGTGGSDILGIDPSVAVAFFIGGLIVYGAFIFRQRAI